MVETMTIKTYKRDARMIAEINTFVIRRLRAGVVSFAGITSAATTMPSSLVRVHMDKPNVQLFRPMKRAVSQ